MTGNHALLTNFVEKFLGTVRFGNNDFTVIAGYEDVAIGSMSIKKVYNVEGLGHNLFSVGQFCDKGLEDAFRKSTCFVQTEDGVDLLTGDRSSNLYTIALNEVASNSSACLLAKASSSQSWLWHQRLSHLNFATINNLVKNNFSRKPNIKFFRMFGCRSYLLNDYDDVGKLKANGMLECSLDIQKSLIMKSSTTNVETSNVKIPSNEEEVFHEVSESQEESSSSSLNDDVQQSPEEVSESQEESSSSSLNDDVQQSPEEVILPQINTQSISNNIVPNVDEASKTIIKTKWIFKNKKDESSLVIRNKVRLVAVGYSQQEGIDYDETFEPVTCIEAIRLFLAYADHKDFTVFQVDVKTSFLNRILKEEVYVGQPLGFVSKQYPDHVYALDKALYGLKQVPWAWYDVLSQFLIESGFQKGSIDTTLFIKKKGKHIMLIQIYVDDIIFGSTNLKYCIKFLDLMVKRFEMSMMGEIKFFLWLQVNQFSNRIIINQSKYILDILKRFGMENCDIVPTPMVEQAKLKLDLVGKPVDHTDYRSMIGSLMYVTSSRPDIMFATCLRYSKDSGFDLTAYSDTDHVGCHLDQKSLRYLKDSGFDLTAYSDTDHVGCHLDQKTESEYVVVFGYCAQVLWMRTQLNDYGFFYDKVPIYCDLKSEIAISCNSVQHTRTKHIDVRSIPELYRKEGVRFSASIFKKEEKSFLT
nr:hypothetical protein [Tanacetum cinerariifolium]